LALAIASTGPSLASEWTDWDCTGCEDHSRRSSLHVEDETGAYSSICRSCRRVAHLSLAITYLCINISFRLANLSAAIYWINVLQGVLAYVVVRPCLAFIQVMCMLTKSWGEDEFTFRKGWLWCMLTNNVMQVRMPCRYILL
jgi:Organic solute transporter Ostalpha